MIFYLEYLYISSCALVVAVSSLCYSQSIDVSLA
jgi:hypothetical protein